jgi:hypothetical protein
MREYLEACGLHHRRAEVSGGLPAGVATDFANEALNSGGATWGEIFQGGINSVKSGRNVHLEIITPDAHSSVLSRAVIRVY